MTLKRTIMLAACTAALAQAASAIAAQPTKPTLLTLDYSARFAVRPHSIVFGNGGVVIGRLRGTSKSGLTWQWWTPAQASQEGQGPATGAYAYGTIDFNTCKPDCAASHYKLTDVGVRADQPRQGHYTRLIYEYEDPFAHELTVAVAHMRKARSVHGKPLYYWGPGLTCHTPGQRDCPSP